MSGELTTVNLKDETAEIVLFKRYRIVRERKKNRRRLQRPEERSVADTARASAPARLIVDGLKTPPIREINLRMN